MDRTRTEALPRLSKADCNALARAIKWAQWFQAREGHIVVVPAVLPNPHTAAWIELGVRCASQAQAFNMQLMPWQCCPGDVVDDGQVCNTYARRPEEVSYLRRMIAAGLSRYEPDPDAALARQANTG